jgi:hypothetical protein
MSTPKPILVIRMPNMLVQSKRELYEQLSELKSKLDDYHLIPLFESGLSRVEFECYSINDHKITLEELKLLNKKVEELLN